MQKVKRYWIIQIMLIMVWQNAMADDMVFNYKLLANGVVVYCGISNNPSFRMEEHKQKGLFYFDKMEVYFLCDDKQAAYEKETYCINSNPIPNMYQTYPRDEEGIAQYESSLRHPKQYRDFIPVVFTTPVKQYLKKLGINYKSLYDQDFRAIEM